MDNIQREGTVVSVQGEIINNVKFADDIAMIFHFHFYSFMDESGKVLMETLPRLEKAGKESGLRFNLEKTKTMIYLEVKTWNRI